MRTQGELDLIKQRPKKKGLTLIGALHIYRPWLHKQALHDPECAVFSCRWQTYSVRPAGVHCVRTVSPTMMDIPQRPWAWPWSSTAAAYGTDWAPCRPGLQITVLPGILYQKHMRHFGFLKHDANLLQNG